LPEDIRNWIQTRLFDEVPVNICVIDRGFQIVEANRGFCEAYGMDCEGQLCYSVYKDRTEPCERCAAVRTFTDGKIRVREEQGVLQNGNPIDYLVHMIPLTRADGEISYVIEMSTDISQIKALEREKLEAERLAAVGQTVAGIAHGIKNVLMGLEGGVYVVGSGIQRGDAQRIVEGWGMLDENIGRISAFVKEFLAFARGRVPQVALTDPNQPARQVVELFRDKAVISGIELNSDLQEDIPPAHLDAEGIHSCLANLISNALDACIMSDQTRKYTVTLSSRERDGILIYEVADNGCGMDYEISRKVFTSFFSTKGSAQGTGLGLLTTKKIVHEHGGEVSFESKEDEGSVFRIRLPRNRLPDPGRAGGEDHPDFKGSSGKGKGNGEG